MRTIPPLTDKGGDIHRSNAMPKRKLTPDEVKAHRQLARAAKRLLRAQQKAREEAEGRRREKGAAR